MRKYFAEIEIKNLVDRFESGTISAEDWRHTEHLTVALVYLSHHDFDAALGKMRSGIFNLLKAFGVDLTKETPYHETLTVFWMQTVDEFRKSKKDNSIVEICNELAAKFDKDYPLKFYSRARLFSGLARAEFIEPDIKKRNETA
jgi:hypothetical protein